MKLLMMSSNVLNSSPGSDVSVFLFVVVVGGGGGGGDVFVFVVVVFSVWVWVVWGFSLVLMDEMLNEGIEVGGCLHVIMMSFGTIPQLRAF